MPTPVLLVLNAVRWFGAARMPRALAQAGFEVTLLTPPGALAEKSSYVAKIAYLPENATPTAWVHAFAATAKATGTRLVMPCDDTAFRLLQMLALSPPEGLQPALHGELAALIADSLGDPTHYQSCIDKALLPAAAVALGVGMPAHAIVSDVAGTEAFGIGHGYPIVLKHRHSVGHGRAIVERESDVASALAALSRSPAEPDASRSVDLLAQAYIRGRAQYYHASAWKGELLAGFAGEKVRAQAADQPPPAVNRYYRNDVLRQIAARLARGFGISGVFSLEGIVAEDGGQFHLLEVNRRLAGGVHRGGTFDVDLCAALHAALQGLPPPARTDMDAGEEHMNVAFPQEWLRDPESEWLRDYPVDVPWDEPELFEAMLALQPAR
ncbi:MAG: hypothetical protein ACHP7M_06350 [Burkholderiales bacterium]